MARCTNRWHGIVLRREAVSVVELKTEHQSRSCNTQMPYMLLNTKILSTMGLSTRHEHTISCDETFVYRQTFATPLHSAAVFLPLLAARPLAQTTAANSADS